MRDGEVIAEDMIDRVARAMFEASREESASRGIQSSWENYPLKAHFINMARAAIKAMREPTRVMHEAGLETTGMPSNTFRDMIDAALGK